MLSLFKPKTAGWVGVDIGSASVKLVALTKHGQSYQIEGYAVVPLPPAAVVDGNVEIPGEVSDAIERGIKICGVSLSHAVTAVPSSAVITKRLEISNAFVGMELEEQVQVEADQFIPYPLEEVALDFEVQGPVDKAPELNDILLVACRRDDADSREEAINGSGLKCEVIDIDTYAIERTLPLLQQGEPGGQLVGIVDIGAATLTLNVFKGNKIIYNREQAFGGNDLTNMIHQQKGIEVADVERMLSSGELDEETMDMLVLPFRQTVVQQVSRALQFYYSSGSQGQLSKLYLAGGTSGLEGLSDMVAEEIGVSTHIANPFVNMQVASKVNAARLQKDAPCLLKACGLAQRSFDI
ncbi:type IV pilus assembly protein PilM [Marinobacterium sediminicola]|uniref:Type IV pilus assembly protein PilM n=1 Tax=Marinobacterium sediminicola TaxID=518898 RepID=A0ABY1S1W3_9GAMM|nr:type IV pilus assembly protein PilM [Marinobacterium sediminicola]ULG69522.1 pilus assembly protein PilM [Marinobacterium sediminicola]SMR75674.1 type IV pilus assembly protein PilM [Marinobacterium sediminicola]